MLRLDSAEKSLQKILLVVSGEEQMHIDFVTKICNCSRLSDDPRSVVTKLGTFISYSS